jgi:CRP-like cAMP-binding protein
MSLSSGQSALEIRTVATTNTSRTVQNRILSALPADLFDTLRPFLTRAGLKRNSFINEANRPVEAIHFIESGVVSRVARTPLDGSVEVAMVDRSGMVGISIVLGATLSLRRSLIVVPGEALQIPTEKFVEVMSQHPRIREHLMIYVRLLLQQKAQTAFCNAKHGLDERLARWLLLVHDRAGISELLITHDLLAMLLGVRRSGISESLAMLETNGLVARQRGALRIVDPDGLKSRACDCYRIMHDNVFTSNAGKSHDHCVLV